MIHEDPDTNRKALAINLDGRLYGTFAEIGAGQETARAFFKVGGASGTVAKTMSAYDMKFSDEIYGKATRYVSRERLQSMLAHEFDLLIERLDAVRGERTHFFAFADTVAATGYGRSDPGHGWLGVRFQREPRGVPHDIMIHVRMLDPSNLLQQQTLGILGVNLLYAAFFCLDNFDSMIRTLVDELGNKRIEVDTIDVRGPAFENLDRRLLSLKLVQHGLTDATLFSPDGEVLLPSEALYKRPVLLQRGSFKPVTYVHLDMLKCAQEQFLQMHGPDSNRAPLVVLEVTLNNLISAAKGDQTDLLDLADTLSALGHHVMVSNYAEFYRLTTYLRRLTKEPIGVVLGVSTLFLVFDDRYYEELDGGILEAFGRLFRQNVTLYVYPMASDLYDKYLHSIHPSLSHRDLSGDGQSVVSVDTLHFESELEHLYRYLKSTGVLRAINDYDVTCLNMLTTDVCKMIANGDEQWKRYVPPQAATIIEQRKMFTKGR